MESLFENWRPRASSFGYLLTNLPEKFTSDDVNKMNELLDEKISGVNANGNKTKWTDTKQSDVDKLKKKREGLDTLPDGAISKLEEIFDSIFWKRKKLLQNKYLEKGNINEEDSLELKSDVDCVSYWKNDEFFDNGYVCGTPDNVSDKIRDIKSNYEFDTFKRAELTTLYAWQIKAYLWLTSLKNGELVYALTNSPAHRIDAEKKSMWFSMGQPDYEEERWIIAASQLEMNHIFYIEKFKEDFPGFDLVNKNWRNIPNHMRIKCFDVTLQDEDIEHMIRRSNMCKKWLLDREEKEIELINSVKF
ncbi:hypothetical protein [Flavobacterium sp.]|uniref:hypothetical protein n=1 Tax=Flavobacterium sp. TaxID=239 RepID=UPI0037522B84